MHAIQQCTGRLQCHFAGGTHGSRGHRISSRSTYRLHTGRNGSTYVNFLTRQHGVTPGACSRSPPVPPCQATNSSTSSSSSASRQWGQSWKPAKKKQRPPTSSQPAQQDPQQQQQQASQGQKSGPVSNVVIVEPIDLEPDATSAAAGAAAGAAGEATSTAAPAASAASAGAGSSAAAAAAASSPGASPPAAAAGPSAAVQGEWSDPRLQGEVAEAVRLTNLVAQQLSTVPALPGCLPLTLLLYDICIARGLPATLRQGYLASKVRPEALAAWPKELATHRYHWHTWVEVGGEVLDLKNALKLLQGPDSGPVQFMRALEWSYETTPPPGALCIDTDAEDPKIRTALRKDYAANLALWQEVEGLVAPGQPVPEQFWQRAVPLKAARDALLQGLR